MRIFPSIELARSEILRDISKTPVVKSTRIQAHTDLEILGREYLGYAYTLTSILELYDPNRIARLAKKWDLLESRQNFNDYVNWLELEKEARLYTPPLADHDHLHRGLDMQREGDAQSYYYSDRLTGSVEIAAHTLLMHPDSRRVYIPIFERSDFVRAGRPTRIPCSLGYWLVLREVDGVQRLHLTYLQRSCDFGRFWLSDVYFAIRYQYEVCDTLNEYRRKVGQDEVDLGHFTHMILSLHTFLKGDDEIY